MAETLLIHYRAGDEQAHWLLCNEAGEAVSKLTRGALAEAAPVAARHPATVLLDSRALHLNHVQLPTQSLQKLRRAVPYALEDDIAEDVEAMHFALSKDSESGDIAVAGINRHSLQACIDAFEAAGINIDAILPDVLCLGGDAQQWVLLRHGDRLLLQTGRFRGQVIDAGLTDYLLQQLQQSCHNDTRPQSLLLFSEADDDTEALEKGLREIMTNRDQTNTASGGESAIGLQGIHYNQHPLTVFCGHYRQALPLNLLQGAFKPRRKQRGYWQYWKLPAALAAIWLALDLGLTGWQWRQLEQANTELRGQIKRIYKQTFPGSRKVVNPRVQMEQKLEALRKAGSGADHGLLFLLAESFGAISLDKKQIKLQSLNYRNGRMEVAIDSSTLQALQALNARLNENRRIHSEIASSSAEKDRVRATLRIEARQAHRGSKPQP